MIQSVFYSLTGSGPSLEPPMSDGIIYNTQKLVLKYTMAKARHNFHVDCEACTQHQEACNMPECCP